MKGLHWNTSLERKCIDKCIFSYHNATWCMAGFSYCNAVPPMYKIACLFLREFILFYLLKTCTMGNIILLFSAWHIVVQSSKSCSRCVVHWCSKHELTRTLPLTDSYTKQTLTNKYSYIITNRHHGNMNMSLAYILLKNMHL